MKKHRNRNIFITIVFLVLIVCYISLIQESKTVDLAGRVDDIEVNSSKKEVIITINESIGDLDYKYKIEIPFEWKCKDKNGKRIAVIDIKEGNAISLNFKDAPEYKDGFFYVKPKGTIKIV